LFIDVSIVGLRVRGLRFVGRPTNCSPLILRPTILKSMNNSNIIIIFYYAQDKKTYTGNTVKNSTHAHTHTVAYTNTQSMIKINVDKSDQLHES